MSRRRKPVADRLWARVEKSDGCWLWRGYVAPDGYGRIGLDARDVALVHRVAYELEVGPIPDGLHIDHLCRVRACVNPAHLEAVTQTENIRRSMTPWGVLQRTGLCWRGHDFSKHAYVAPGGAYRTCRRCSTERQRERRAAKRAAA